MREEITDFGPLDQNLLRGTIDIIYLWHRVDDEEAVIRFHWSRCHGLRFVIVLTETAGSPLKTEVSGISAQVKSRTQ